MYKIGKTPKEKWVVGKVLEERAAEFPDHPIVYWEEETYSYSDLNRTANRFARGLKEISVNQGDRIAVMMSGSPTYIGVWFGIAKIGAIEVPINTAYKGDLLSHIINSAGVTVAVIENDFALIFDEILHSCPKLRRIIVHEPDNTTLKLQIPDGNPFDDMESVLSDMGDNFQCDVTSESTACIMFTSGTTGPSKGVIINNAFELSFAVIFNEIVSLKQSDITYNFLPFFHIAGKFILLGTMFVNGKMILRPRFSVEKFWKDVRRFGATVTVGVGGICQMLYAQPREDNDSSNTLRMIYSVPNPHDVLEQFKSRFNLELTEGYGSTEANIVVYTRPDEETPLGAAGRAAPYYDIRVVDTNDQEVSAGISGEIIVRPKYPNILMEGYYGLPEKTLETFKNLWFHSGDRGMMDKNGYLFFLDRMKDAIRRRGENISSFEVERITAKHAAVSEVAAIAVPADVGEDEVKVVVVLQSNKIITESELFQHCAQEMPYFMVPRFIEFVDNLPRTPTQKVRKIELRTLGVTKSTWDCEEHGMKITRRGIKSIT
ncbi:MAG: hypothetical protein CMM30_02160 [Rhodospirillaceae bacterium]|nr:hypothetical protein [Rhodospirillaceae bacterium]|tara:strand:- start:10796 stop:12430 length:1635 start_codon:yes stop_codon:yes gene_type:complete